MRKLTLHQKRAGHLTLQDNCWGCRMSSITVGTIEGGTRGPQREKTSEVTVKKEINAYERARKAGEKPEASTLKGIEKTRRKQESIERGLKKADTLVPISINGTTYEPNSY